MASCLKGSQKLIAMISLRWRPGGCRQIVIVRVHSFGGVVLLFLNRAGRSLLLVRTRRLI
jgi:hypothetical protein